MVKKKILMNTVIEIKRNGTHRNICKECTKLYTKQYNDSTKEIRSQKSKIYRENNKEKNKRTKETRIRKT